MELHEFLTVKRAEIISRWTQSIRHVAPESITRIELVDHLPGFLDEVTTWLRRSRAPTVPTDTAAEHGTQRFGLGFNLSALVREYGLLHKCIVEMTNEAKLKISSADFIILFDCLLLGITDAVIQYSAEKEADQHRQSNEHFAFIAHELRNPLTAAMLSLGSLQTRKLLPETRHVEILQLSLNRMNDLIERTLDTAAVGAGMDLVRRPSSVRSLVAEASFEALVHAEEKEVILDIQKSGDEEINIDYRLILSALSNLIRNAVKFTRSDSTVHVRWHEADGQMHIEVEDQCGGLPPGKSEKLFTSFVQAGTDRSGFGLGLAIAKQAAEAHGGSIQVRNIPDRGCVFSLVVPAAK